MRKTSILTTAATVGLLVLSGCGDDDAADTGAGTATTPATESPEATTSAPSSSTARA